MKIVLSFTLLAAVFTTGSAHETHLRRRLSREDDVSHEDGPLPIDGDESELETIAKYLETDIETAREHMKVQREFKKLLGKLEKHDDFAEAAMAENPGEPLQVSFKFRIPDDLDQEIENFKSKMRVDVNKNTAKKSLKDHEKVAEKITKLLEKKGGFSDVGYVIGDGFLQMTAVTDDPNEDMSKEKNIKLEKLEKKARKILGKHLDEEELDGTVLLLSSKPDLDHHTRGGNPITGCTTGFSVKNHNTGKKGITTAAHCPNTGRYYSDIASEGSYPTTMEGEYNGYWGDVQWHTNPDHVVIASFWAKPTERWWVNSFDSSFAKNEVVCAYSRIWQRRDCDRVLSPTVTQGGNKRLVGMRWDHTTFGDSGGPWSNGSVAAGINKGAKYWWWYCGFLSWCGNYHSTWSRVSYFPNMFPGLRILTRYE